METFPVWTGPKSNATKVASACMWCLVQWYDSTDTSCKPICLRSDRSRYLDDLRLKRFKRKM